jgi:cell division protease FtsH
MADMEESTARAERGADAAQSAGAPATADAAQSAGAPATADAAQSAGAPATADAARSTGAPATANAAATDEARADAANDQAAHSASAIAATPGRTAMLAAPRLDSKLLASEWRRLRQAATAVAVFTSPFFFVVLYDRVGLSLAGSVAATIGAVIAFRGLVDVTARRLLPWPSMYGVESSIAEEDVVARRRTWFWRSVYRKVFFLAVLIAVVGTIIALAGHHSWWGGVTRIFHVFGLIGGVLPNLAFTMIVFFLINVFILFGPLLAANMRQVRGYEPGDANWGVKVDDVRGQAEPKEEVARVVQLWQSGEDFERAGGKRERGLLFLGAPGTGKTMLAKAIATNFNCPFVTIPGSGFAATFIGIDVIVVMFLIRKAKRLARKWGGQCIVFIDEIDAVGMRRAALGGGGGGFMGNQVEIQNFEDYCFFGPWGSMTPSGDVIVETRAWRERLFASRQESRSPVIPPIFAKPAQWIERIMFPGMMGGMGGGLALNQLLVQMDGIGEAPFTRRFFTNRINTILDASYLVPRRVGGVSLRLPAPKPASEQVFFIGATNVPIDRLDPALIRPGRMGRHVWFRTPTFEDRKDIFNLYLGKVDHRPDLDTDQRRDELARITNGYSPAMIEQVCSMALTYSHADGRQSFGWTDIVEAMTTVESGTAQNIEYIPEESRAVAIHEAGHAAAGHVYLEEDVLSTRLSIRKRGGSLGHYQSMEKDERFSQFRSRVLGGLIMTLGAMAAEHVVYGENSQGVGGDVYSATVRAALMVGMWGMGADPVHIDGSLDPDENLERILNRLERIGNTIMNQTSGAAMMSEDPVAAILRNREKRQAAAQLLGQAYVSAYALMAANREALEKIADVLVDRKEIYGDEVTELLDSVDLKRPELNLMDDSTWPQV